MRTMLVTYGGTRFSKTARSRPRLREAGGHRAQICRPLAVRRRRLADDLVKRAAERAEAGEADVQADVAHAALGLAQHEHRTLHPPALEITMGCLTEGGAKGPDEVRLGDVGDPRERLDVERLREVAVHCIARSQHAAVGLLNGSAHRTRR